MSENAIRFTRGIMLLLSGVLAFVGAAQAADPLFQSTDTLQVEISAPLSTLVRERSETTYLPGTFSYKAADGTPVELELRIRARGNFRHRNCDFPPVTLNFRRSQVDGTLFDGQNKLKLVGHCKITRRYEQSVLREYLAYRLLNILTDLSFRVRLLQVTWVDSEGRRGRMVRNAFLMESRDRLADRIGLEEQEIESAEISAVRPGHLNLTSLFQYLIGNVDFSPIAVSAGPCCHNYEMFGTGPDALVAIPFDFDFSGFVNAPNAIPDVERGIERVGQRLYRGYCVNNAYVEGSVARFRDARDELYALVSGQEELEPNVRENIAEYMDGFYAVIDDPARLEEEIIGKCRP